MITSRIIRDPPPRPTYKPLVVWQVIHQLSLRALLDTIGIYEISAFGNLLNICIYYMHKQLNLAIGSCNLGCHAVAI